MPTGGKSTYLLLRYAFKGASQNVKNQYKYSKRWI